jgi:hypothetical protein
MPPKLELLQSIDKDHANYIVFKSWLGGWINSLIEINP